MITALQVPCSLCGRQPGDDCLTPEGVHVQPHRAREKAAERAARRQVAASADTTGLARPRLDRPSNPVNHGDLSGPTNTRLAGPQRKDRS